MPTINILSPHLADMIAAGEVVERPASVVKELVENALDAGARSITVEIRGGGATFIRVTDDGCGMAPEDAGIAFMRHATSKLSDERGLECISTMGFRGEALAAISAVSRVELKTRRFEDNEGCFVRLEAGEIQDMGLCGCPVGTVMCVRDLFFNTPARLKFLKSDRTEAAACEHAALKCALGHPEVSVRFIKDGREGFFSPGDSRAESCVYSLLGRDIASGFLPCRSEDETGMRVRGFISSPSAARGNRSCQYFYCNGRSIRSPLMQSALEQAYKNSLLTGRFPACVLYLELGHGNVDVNVHPAKTEVKFSYERKVFELVYQAAVLALEQEKPAVSASLSSGKPERAASLSPRPREDFYQRMSSEQFRQNIPAPSAAQAPGETVRPARYPLSQPAAGGSVSRCSPAESPAAANSYVDFAHKASREAPHAEEGPVNPCLKSPQAPYSPADSPAQTTIFAPPAPEKAPEARSSSENFENSVENSVQNVENELLPFRLIGEAMRTYILVEQEGSLILIDKHAAHERIIFDRLRSHKSSIMAQTLLSPALLTLSGEDSLILEENSALLSQLGFETEAFGEHSFVVRAVPADMDSADAAAAIEEICEKLRQGPISQAEIARDEILHTVACKAAIKAGWSTQPQELETLVKAVLSGRVKYCPHGRPVAVRLSRRELDKQFKRIV